MLVAGLKAFDSQCEDNGMKKQRVWVTKGFESFRKGTFGNGGQNLYVSRSGVLQRIHQFDLSGDGYFDLIICNSQPHGEQPPSFVYQDPLGKASRQEVFSDGGWSGMVSDLNGDGYDDLIIGMTNNGSRSDLNAFVYYGSPEGFTEKRMTPLPAPMCVSVATGDLNGDDKQDVAMVCKTDLDGDHQVRIFYQTDLGLEMKRFIDTGIQANQIAVSDLDGDGFADLVTRSIDGEIRIYWGSEAGIKPEEYTPVPIALDEPELTPKEIEKELLHSDYNADAPPLVKVLSIDGLPHILVIRHQSTSLVPVSTDHTLLKPLVLDVPRVMSADIGDVNGNGYDDIVLACRQTINDREVSWIYWGSADGYSTGNRTALPSNRACDVLAHDLNGNGFDDVVLCQNHTADSFTTQSLIYRGSPDIDPNEPVKLETFDPRRVFPVHNPDKKTPAIAFINHYSRLIHQVNPTIFYGGPDGYSAERSEEVYGVGTVEALRCDINDDGKPDLIFANSSHNSKSRDPGSFVYLNGPNGFGSKPDYVLPTMKASGIVCADIDHDGYLDLIVSGYFNEEIVVFRGTPDGFDTDDPQRIRVEHEGVLFNYGLWLFLADLNNDGWLDLVVPQTQFDRSFVLWGGPNGFSSDRMQLLSVDRAACVQAADFTGNGYLDLVMGGHGPTDEGPHDSFAHIYWNGPDGLREDRKTLLPGNAINSMSIADFNNDGTLDLFVGSYQDGRVRDLDSYIYWNRQGTRFSTMDRRRLFTHSASGSVAADFNENGWVDLAIANHKVYGDQVAYSDVWWNGPDGFDEKHRTHLPSSGPHGMTSVDPGNLMDRGHEEYYVSEPHEVPEGARDSSITWTADVPEKTWVKAQLRFADTPDNLDSAGWSGPDGTGNTWLENGDQPILEGRWVQYQLAIGALNSLGTPRVTEVAIKFS